MSNRGAEEKNKNVITKLSSSRQLQLSSIFRLSLYLRLSCFFEVALTLSAMGVAGPSIIWGGGQFDPHFLTAPWGLLGHNSFSFNHSTV